MPQKHCEENMWLVKPSSKDQGFGIKVFKNLNAIMDYINSSPHLDKFVVQKYIEKPLLFNNRKFDIRVWVIATSKGELYFYNEGYLRTSS